MLTNRLFRKPTSKKKKDSNKNLVQDIGYRNVELWRVPLKTMQISEKNKLYPAKWK